MVINSIVTIKNGNFALYSNINFYFNDQNLKEVAGEIFGMIANY
jgi:hypothetical protein